MDEPDFESLLSEFDLRDMAGFTRKFVEDLRLSLTTGLDLEEDTDWSGVLCLGMGGSGAGGLFLKALSDDSGGLPFVVWTDYGVPSWWGPEWLVIATSYSGNTEETLDGVREVISAGGTVVGICSGGELEDVISQSEGSACLNVPPGQMPRSAFGHILGTQLSACWALGILPKPSSVEIEEMLSRLSRASSESDLSTKVAWTGTSAHDRALLVLSSKDLHPRTNSRIEWMLEEIEAKPAWVIDCEGESLLERLLYAAHVTDWVSIGLALLTGEDPSDMPAIESLKSHLSSLQ